MYIKNTGELTITIPVKGVIYSLRPNRGQQFPDELLPELKILVEANPDLEMEAEDTANIIATTAVLESLRKYCQLQALTQNDDFGWEFSRYLDTEEMWTSTTSFNNMFGECPKAYASVARVAPSDSLALQIKNTLDFLLGKSYTLADRPSPDHYRALLRYGQVDSPIPRAAYYQAGVDALLLEIDFHSCIHIWNQENTPNPNPPVAQLQTIYDTRYSEVEAVTLADAATAFMNRLVAARGVGANILAFDLWVRFDVLGLLKQDQEFHGESFSEYLETLIEAYDTTHYDSMDDSTGFFFLAGLSSASIIFKQMGRTERHEDAINRLVTYKIKEGQSAGYYANFDGSNNPLSGSGTDNGMVLKALIDGEKYAEAQDFIRILTMNQGDAGNYRDLFDIAEGRDYYSNDGQSYVADAIAEAVKLNIAF